MLMYSSWLKSLIWEGELQAFFLQSSRLIFFLYHLGTYLNVYCFPSNQGLKLLYYYYFFFFLSSKVLNFNVLLWLQDLTLWAMCLNSASCDVMLPNFGACFRNDGRLINTTQITSWPPQYHFPFIPLTLKKIPLWFIYFIYLLISFPLFYKGYSKACSFKKKWSTLV